MCEHELSLAEKCFALECKERGAQAANQAAEQQACEKATDATLTLLAAFVNRIEED